MRQWPFVVLTLIVSTSAVYLSTLVQVQQNREQIDLYTPDAATRNTRKAIVALYKSVDVAFANKNIDQLFSYFAPNFTFFNIDETVLNRQQFRQRTIEYWQLTGIPKVRHEVKQIQDSNGTMSVVVVTYFGSEKNLKDNECKDVLKLTNHGWEIISRRMVGSSNIGIYHYP